MNWIIVGSFAFILLTLFDANKVYRWHTSLNLLFPLSLGILVLSTFQLYLIKDAFGVFNTSPLFYGLVLLGLFEQIYALFFALPLKKTYTELTSVELVDTGLYGLCRHPGVWGFMAMGLGLSLALGSYILLTTALIWSLLDVLHVYVQDRLFFPKTIPGYLSYQKQVPFLFFGVKEIKRCLG